ncbi:heme-binding protein [Tropicimonas sp. TH_r6]
MVGGGLPVIGDGDVVGGLGVSSGLPAQDLEVGQAGIDALLAGA